VLGRKFDIHTSRYRSLSSSCKHLCPHDFEIDKECLVLPSGCLSPMIGPIPSFEGPPFEVNYLRLSDRDATLLIVNICLDNTEFSA